MPLPASSHHTNADRGSLKNLNTSGGGIGAGIGAGLRRMSLTVGAKVSGADAAPAEVAPESRARRKTSVLNFLSVADVLAKDEEHADEAAFQEIRQSSERDKHTAQDTMLNVQTFSNRRPSMELLDGADKKKLAARLEAYEKRLQEAKEAETNAFHAEAGITETAAASALAATAAAASAAASAAAAAAAAAASSSSNNNANTTYSSAASAAATATPNRGFIPPLPVKQQQQQQQHDDATGGVLQQQQPHRGTIRGAHDPAGAHSPPKPDRSDALKDERQSRQSVGKQSLLKAFQGSSVSGKVAVKRQRSSLNAGHKDPNATKVVRTVATQSGTPRLDTAGKDIDDDESKAYVEIGETVLRLGKRLERKTRENGGSVLGTQGTVLDLAQDGTEDKYFMNARNTGGDSSPRPSADRDSVPESLEDFARGVKDEIADTLGEDNAGGRSPMPSPKSPMQRRSVTPLAQPSPSNNSPPLPSVPRSPTHSEVAAMAASRVALAAAGSDEDGSDDVEEGSASGGDDSQGRETIAEGAPSAAEEAQDLDNAGSMFAGIGDAVVTSDWEEKWHVWWRVRGRNILNNRYFQFFVGIATIYAIIGLEVFEASFGSSRFLGLGICTFLSFLLFLFEIVSSSLCIEHYTFSFFWWLDVVGTLSLIPDVPFIWPDTMSLDGLALARAGRVARTGTRAIRVVRFFRILRLLRLFRIVKFVSRQKDKDKKIEVDNGSAVKNDEETVQSSAHSDAEMHAYRTKLAKQHAAVVEMRVVGGVILMLLIMPNLEYASVDNSSAVGLEVLHAAILTKASNETLTKSMEIYFALETSLVSLVCRGIHMTRHITSLENVVTETDLGLGGSLDGDVSYIEQAKPFSRTRTQKLTPPHPSPPSPFPSPLTPLRSQRRTT